MVGREVKRKVYSFAKSGRKWQGSDCEIVPGNDLPIRMAEISHAGEQRWRIELFTERFEHEGLDLD